MSICLLVNLHISNIANFIELGPPGPLGLHGLDGLKGVKGDMGTRGVSLPLVTLAIKDSLEIQFLALTFWALVIFYCST